MTLGYGGVSGYPDQGGGGDNLVIQDWYFDWNDYSEVDISTATTTSANIAIGERKIELLSAVTAPNGDGLDTFTAIILDVMYYDGGWYNSGDKVLANASNSGIGIECGLTGSDSFYIITGLNFIYGDYRRFGGSNPATSGSSSSVPCVIHARAFK